LVEASRTVSEFYVFSAALREITGLTPEHLTDAMGGRLDASKT
jgi:hypothetical protein